jgi:Uma2 family endonuclease
MHSSGAHRVTSQEFLTHPLAAGRSELVRGDVRLMTPASGAHGVIAGRLFAALNAFVEERQLGQCFPDNTGFLLPGLGDTVRSPDVAFVDASRLGSDGIGPGWIAVAPDLAVEILSPNETAAELDAKLRDYRTAGTRLMCVVDPIRRVVSIRDGEWPERLVAESDTLDGGSVLPGFAIPVSRLFARLAR